MSVLKPRERSVYFRISEDEFHQFVGVCEQQGARSVSDLARNAVQRLIADCNRQREDVEVTPKVQVLEKLIADVTRQLELLNELLQQRELTGHHEASGKADGHASAATSDQR